MRATESVLRDIPVYALTTDTIDAGRYNRVRVVLRRVANPMRVELRGLRGLDLILDDGAWVCVDRTLNDVPVLAWTGFRTRERTGLHQPVVCELRYYHAHAHMIRDKVLGLMDRVLSARRFEGSEVAPS